MKRKLFIFSTALLLLMGISLSNTSMATNPEIEKPVVPVYEVNVNGQTYGNVNPELPPELQVYPDLIAAIGIDDVEGYVYASDLNGDQPKNPEEAIAYMENLEQEIETAKLTRQEYLDTIPLYDSDGVTIIGAFPISFSYEITN